MGYVILEALSFLWEALLKLDKSSSKPSLTFSFS